MKMRIASIEVKNEESVVYNFAVEDDESYFLNGVMSHNCRCSLAAASSDLEMTDETQSKKDFDEWLNS